MQTHGLGKLFFHMVKLTRAPLIHRGKSSQLVQPYYWARPVIFRLPRLYTEFDITKVPTHKGVVIGWWHAHKRLDVTQHLAQALSLCPVDCAGLPTEDRYYGADPERVA